MDNSIQLQGSENTLAPAMAKKSLYLSFLVFMPCLLLSFPASAQSGQCVVSDSSLFKAKRRYANECSLKRIDCDKVNGVWYCSSSKIKKNTFLKDVNETTSTSSTSSIQAPSHVTSAGATPINISGSPLACSDPDGDGWGWNGTDSCKIGADIFVSSELQVVANGVPRQHEGSAVPENCHKLDSGDYHLTELVTDLFVTAGQSNATGDQTRYQPERFQADRVNNRLIVWTANNRWEIANPRSQIWHNGKYPGGHRVFNHPAFQIGRAIANSDECRVVAFIATAAAGMPIDHWRHNRDNHFTEITDTVTAAINALPVKYQVDMIWWMQGEADNDQIVQRYFNKLQGLIAKFRNESWFAEDGYFLSNETGWFSYANQAIRMLRTDGSKFTDYSAGEDSLYYSFPSRSTEIDKKVHFNEVSLRRIGDLVAEKYLGEYQFLKNR